ncbi:cytochrome p450 [Plakobranchus ocellatus]|uniref:Cytochrome p450 n=1 Tax=Plakobranchus ocellatus TaxID=259542 RepID=A0AAV4CU17_9GAST|nr:cytochrome p450 [Plakobranchus ocellatus]
MDIELPSHSKDAHPNVPRPLPGPRGLPLVGSLFEYQGPQTNLKWTEMYGPVYHVRMGGRRLVYLNTIELVEKYLEGPAGEQFLNRPTGPAAFGEGLLFGSGETWRSNKQAFYRVMQSETLQRDMEDAIHTELHITLRDFHTRAGLNGQSKIGDALLPACANIVCGFLLGRSLPEPCQERESLLSFAKNLENVDLNSPVVQLSLKYPNVVKYLRKCGFRNIVDVWETSKSIQIMLRHWIFLARSINRSAPYHHSHHFGSLPSGLDIPGCQVIDKKIWGQGETGGQNSPVLSNKHELMTSLHKDQVLPTASEAKLTEETRKCRTELAPPELVPKTTANISPVATVDTTVTGRQVDTHVQPDSILHRLLNQPEFAAGEKNQDTELLQSLVDMFFGGVNTTLSALEFILMYLSTHPWAQILAQEEISSVLAAEADGSENHGDTSQADIKITWSMRDRMPYVWACVTEAQRLGCVTPSSLPHVASVDTEIEGYPIDKGTIVLASIYSLHRDPREYLDPTEYRPHRHLDEQRNLRQPKSYRPFGVGELEGIKKSGRIMTGALHSTTFLEV